MRLDAAARRTGAQLCVGLDPHISRLPRRLLDSLPAGRGADWRRSAASAALDFNLEVLEAIADLVPAVKPQTAFYEALGSAGWRALEDTCAAARRAGLLVVLDAKRGDIQSTGAAYTEACLDDAGPLAADAVTLSPWMGLDTLDPFLELARTQGKGVFVLARTTNPGSALLQCHGSPRAVDALLDSLHARAQSLDGDLQWSSLGVVVGAQAHAEAPAIRSRLPRGWFLVPGMGAQGATARQALAGAVDGGGVLVACSRAALFPDAPNAAFEADAGAFARSQVRGLVASLRAGV